MKHPTEFIIFENQLEQQVQEKRQTNVAAVKNILNNEYNEWLFIRQYVVENMHKLMGKMFPIEVSSLQDIRDPYNCVVVNDIEILPYLRVYEEIKLVEEQMEKLEKKKKLEQAICPKCDAELETKPNMFHWRGQDFSGLVCKECNSLWDFDDQFVKYTLCYSKLEKEGRASGS